MARAGFGVRDELLLGIRRRVPKDLRDVPGAVAVVDDEAVAQSVEFAVGAEQGFGGGTLEEGSGLRVDGRAEEVVGGGVANVELQVGVDAGEFDEIGW